MHPLLAFREFLPPVPLHELDRTVVADAEHPIRPDGEEVRRRRTASRDVEILVFPSVDHAVGKLRPEMPVALRAR